MNKRSEKTPLHNDELAIDAALVRGLVDQALPQFRDLPLTQLPASGSTNIQFRLGDELVVRLPRQPGGSSSIDKEAAWLPLMRRVLPIEVPEVVAVCEPALGYPERWSVVRWIEGEALSIGSIRSLSASDSCALGVSCAAVVHALQDIQIPEGARNDDRLRWYRGEPLKYRDAATVEAIKECRALPGLDVDLDAVLSIWRATMALPDQDASSSNDRWYHGDLVGENLLVQGSRLHALLDFGGLAVGLPTVDLIAAWDVLNVPSREAFRRVVEVSDEEWVRGRGWALALAVNTFPYYWDTMPERCRTKVATLEAVIADAYND